MIVIDLLFAGFFTCIGWWGAEHYVIEPYFPPSIEQREDKNEKNN
jgi:hypothetical protein